MIHNSRSLLCRNLPRVIIVLYSVLYFMVGCIQHTVHRPTLARSQSDTGGCTAADAASCQSAEREQRFQQQGPSVQLSLSER